MINLNFIIVYLNIQYYYYILYGYSARTIRRKKQMKKIIEQILSSLRRIYPSITYPIKWLITRWKSDPFSHGSYSSFHQGK